MKDKVNIEEQRRQYNIALNVCEEIHEEYRLTEAEHTKAAADLAEYKRNFRNEETRNMYPNSKFVEVHENIIPLELIENDPEYKERWERGEV